MQKCYLVINKETQVASYLEHRSIITVTEEHRSLSEIDLQKINIVDVDKFLYIYYQTDDGDLSFRSDMNALRNLMSSAFFHVSEMMFILVNSTNPLLEDLIHSALRDSPISRDKVEIITHSGALMLVDVGRYLSGFSAGQNTSSSYRDVFISEADKEEKERFLNVSGGVEAVLPALTDMAALYQQRAGVEAISAGRIITEHSIRPSFVKDFTRITTSITESGKSFVVSGERWSFSEKSVGYLVQYLRSAGRRVLIVNLSKPESISRLIGPCSALDLMQIKVPVTPEYPISLLSCNFNQLGYLIEFLHNIKGIEEYIYYCDEAEYMEVSSIIHQMNEDTSDIFVAHYSQDSIENFINSGKKATSLFLCSSRFREEFSLQIYREDLKDILVVEFPLEDVDCTEFYEYAIGGYVNE